MKLLIFFYLSMVAHFVFDFIWQGGDIAFKKRFANRYMLQHVFIMGASSGLIIGLYFQSLSVFLQASFCVAITHLIIDAVRVELNRKLKDKFSTPFWQYLGIDQILHTLVNLLVFAYFN